MSYRGGTGWEEAIRDIDAKLAVSILEEVSGVLPFVLLENKLYGSPASEAEFKEWIRSQTSHLFLKKGPRSGTKNESTRPKDGRNDDAIKRRYYARIRSEHKVLGSLFHLIWPPATYGMNTITFAVAPAKKGKGKRNELSVAERILARRLNWQFAILQNRIAGYTMQMKKLSAMVPTFFKPLPVLFFNVARFFVAVHYEQCFQASDEELSSPQEDNVTELLAKVAASFIKLKKGLSKSHNRAGVGYKDQSLDEAFSMMLKASEALLVDMANLVSPEIAYDNEQYVSALRAVRCPSGNPICRYSSRHCFLGEQEVESDSPESTVGFHTLNDRNAQSGEALGFAAFFMEKCERVYESRLNGETLSNLRIRIVESSVTAHSFASFQQTSKGGENVRCIDAERIKGVKAQVLMFWRSVFESVHEVSLKTRELAEEHDADVMGCLLEEIVTVPIAANVAQRPNFIGDLIAKLTEIDSDFQSERPQRRKRAARSGKASKTKRRKRNSSFGRAAFDGSTDSSHDDSESSSQSSLPNPTHSDSSGKRATEGGGMGEVEDDIFGSEDSEVEGETLELDNPFTRYIRRHGTPE